MSDTRAWSIAVISARSCSVSRSPGSRKKSRRTVAKRPRPARRAGATVAVGCRRQRSAIPRAPSAPFIDSRVNAASIATDSMVRNAGHKRRSRGVEQRVTTRQVRPRTADGERNGGEDRVAAGEQPRLARKLGTAPLGPRRLGEGRRRQRGDQRAPAAAVAPSTSRAPAAPAPRPATASAGLRCAWRQAAAGAGSPAGSATRSSGVDRTSKTTAGHSQPRVKPKAAARVRTSAPHTSHPAGPGFPSTARWRIPRRAAAHSGWPNRCARRAIATSKPPLEVGEVLGGARRAGAGARLAAPRPAARRPGRRAGAGSTAGPSRRASPRSSRECWPSTSGSAGPAAGAVDPFERLHAPRRRERSRPPARHLRRAARQSGRSGARPSPISRISEPASNRLAASLPSLTGTTCNALGAKPLERLVERLRARARPGRRSAPRRRPRRSAPDIRPGSGRRAEAGREGRPDRLPDRHRSARRAPSSPPSPPDRSAGRAASFLSNRFLAQCKDGKLLVAMTATPNRAEPLPAIDRRTSRLGAAGDDGSRRAELRSSSSGAEKPRAEAGGAGGRAVLGWALGSWPRLWLAYTAWSAGRALAERAADVARDRAVGRGRRRAAGAARPGLADVRPHPAQGSRAVHPLGRRDAHEAQSLEALLERAVAADRRQSRRADDDQPTS